MVGGFFGGSLHFCGSMLFEWILFRRNKKIRFQFFKIHILCFCIDLRLNGVFHFYTDR